jgi:cytochrome b561
MTKTTQVIKYNYILRIIHWLMAVMLLGMVAAGYFMVGLDAKVAPYKWQIYNIHKTLGVLLLALAVIRMVVRNTTQNPPPAARIAPLYQLLSRATHIVLYIFMIILPLTGVLMSLYGGRDIGFSGLKFTWFPIDKPVAKMFWQIHVLAPYIFLGVVFLHVAGALKHRYIDKTDVLYRMDLKK